MGKVKATELKNGRIDHVSFVDKGANGKKFTIFKSADYKEIDKTDDKTEFRVTDEEIGVLKKITNFFTKKNNEEASMDSKDIQEKLDKVLESIESIDKRVESVENKIDDGGGDAGKQEKGEGDPPAEGNPTEESDSSPEGNPTEKPGEDIKKEDIGKIAASFEKVSSSIEDIGKRLEKIEAVRTPSKSVPDDGTVKTEKSDFDNFFIKEVK